MIYASADDWRNAAQKKVLLFGMSGLGKTHLSNMLRDAGDWFHYSIDYRIGTRYMGEHIADNAKREAMKVPFLRDLLLSDSIYIGSNITFNNLAPLSTYLGKPGNPDLGGVPFEEYMRRQDQHRTAEIAALLDTPHFVNRAHDLYGYDHFICDTGGSICEVVDPENPDDPILKALSQNTLMVWIKGSDDHAAELARRFDKAPKPMYYQPQFLKARWSEYLETNGLNEHQVDPDAFVRWTYAAALAHRQPLYQGMANWGVTVTAQEVAAVKTTSDFDDLIAAALERA
ncbi:ATPase [Shimia thalassica]|uniref:ATPase n=1 Tax=Shimia thalassica TaxID=1715693 RepID=UPI001C08FA24|nr:ATPase [Shimia thalassica]MBU2942031.1 ATPase [Shimia thalassica]MDO6503000.1 ATPase [Shimia thalassica]